MSVTRNEAQRKHWQPYEVKLIDGKVVAFRDVVVHTIRIGDVEDTDLYICEWQQSDAGKFIMDRAVDKPYWSGGMDLYSYYGYTYRIVARLSEQNECFWRLKWGGINK